MTRPPLPPLRPLPRAPGRFRQVPPAIFPPIFGLLGLGLAWRAAAGAFGVPADIGETILGAATLLVLFAIASYLVKVALRPGVVGEDLQTLPGRAGLAAATLSVLLMAAVAVPYAPGLGRTLLFGGLALHAGLALTVAGVLISGPREQRGVTPVWHLSFVGFILAPLSAVPLGLTGLATAIPIATIPVAALIWAFSARAILAKGVPPPLRPTLAIHLAPAALFATVAARLELPVIAMGFCVAALALAALLLWYARWLTSSGFTPLWGAFTFPAAAACSACFAQGAEPFRSLGGVMLVGATLMIAAIAWRVMRLWADGRLAQMTNAAVARS